jgi:hypothetical protein
MAYIYRHIRLDKNEIFYIGIGSDNKEEYERAYSKKDRNKHWHNIAKFGYEVEIILDDLTWEEACSKEIEFIKLYGRKDLNEGTLVNMTDGGEGTIGIVITEESRKRISESIKGRKLTLEHRNKISNSLKDKPQSDSKKEKCRLANLGDKSPSKRLEVRKKISNTLKGHNYHPTTKVYQYDKDGKFLAEYESMSLASKITNIPQANISKVCCGIRKLAGGYYWKKIK